VAESGVRLRLRVNFFSVFPDSNGALQQQAFNARIKLNFKPMARRSVSAPCHSMPATLV
jgi:hypothetical protein